MLQLIKELIQHYDVEPFVIMPNTKKNEWSLAKELDLLNVPYVTSRFYPFKFSNSKGKIKWLLNIILFPIILMRLRRVKFDLIHSNSSVTELGAYISIVFKKPHIWHLREFGDKDFNSYPICKTYELKVYRHCDAFIAISKAIQKYYENKIDNKNKIKLIYDGIKDKGGKKNAHSYHKVELCIVGITSEAKNQIEALQALYKVIYLYGFKNLHLTIIGNDQTPYMDKLSLYIKENKISEYITFTGETTDVDSILQHMDIGLMLSKCEAFGRVTIEYMLHELAIIASNTGANPELITNGENGLLYELNDIDSLAKEILYLCQNKDTRRKMGLKARQIAINKFTSDSNTKKVYDLYTNILHSQN